MPPTPEQWIRLLEGSHSEHDEDTLRRWLAEDAANPGIWADYQQLWQRYGAFAATHIQQNPPRTALAWQRLQQDMHTAAAPPPTARFARAVWAVAAAAVLLLALGGWWLWQQQQQQQTYLVVAADGIRQYTLPDGSIATLRPGSRLRYGRQFNHRHRILHLEGEAFFEVQRRENLPFVVQSPAGAVEVLGTSFLVEAGSHDSLLLSVFTGVTALYGVESPQQRTQVAAQQSAVRTAQGVAMRHFRAGRLAWKTGQLEHQAAPLGEVLSDLEHWHGVRIRIENDALLRCQVTIALQDERAEAALAAIAAIFDMKLEALGTDGFLLKGGRCK